MCSKLQFRELTTTSKKFRKKSKNIRKKKFLIYILELDPIKFIILRLAPTTIRTFAFQTIRE